MSGDDAAGLAVANAYRSDVAVINQGIRNANDGLSTLQIKDGALNNIATLIDRLATLASQSASGSTTDASRLTLQQEADAVVAEIGREATVAGLDTQAGFSIFVSNDGTNGVVSGSLSAGHHDLPRDQRSRHQRHRRCEDGGCHPDDGHRDARHRSGLGRHHREPAAVRHHAGAVAEDQQAGRREPDPRRQRG